MTKTKMGRPIKFHDAVHKKWAKTQTTYNRKMRAIAKEFPDLTHEQVLMIYRQRKAERVGKELKQKLDKLKET